MPTQRCKTLLVAMTSESIYDVTFVTNHLYYLPQFLPVAKELKKRNKKILFLLLGYDLPLQNQIALEFLIKNDYECRFYNQDDDAIISTFLVSGANGFPVVNVKYKYSCLIVHGIGTKAGYYTDEQNKYDIRFVEGQHRVDVIKDLYPNAKSKLFNVGFAKLDGVFDISDEEKSYMMIKMGFDPRKKTILYAPTFYPSSIDKMPDTFPADFREYNLIIKPHFFSFLIKTYRHHLKIFKQWAKYPNVYFAGVEDFNLVPFMSLSDIMISDESSAIFEFAALDKPVVCNRNVKFRLTYRLFKWKKQKRMDAQMDPFREVATSIYKYSELKTAISSELANPSLKSIDRQRICQQIVGTVDGNVSVRIANIMESLVN